MASRRTLGGGVGIVTAVAAALGAWLLVPNRPGPARTAATPTSADSVTPSGEVRTPTMAPALSSTQPATRSPEELFAGCAPAVVRVFIHDRHKRPAGMGSGFFVSPDGLLVTNHHVIAGAATIKVVLHSDAELNDVDVVGIDPAADLALLRVRARGQAQPHLELADGLPAIGTRAYAIGSPQGLSNTLSEGLVSGVRGPDGEAKLIQTTAAISPGSSGGPLLNAYGRVVGVTTLYLAKGQNLNFAVEAQRVRRLVDNPKSASATTRPHVAPDAGAAERREAAGFWLERASTEAANVRAHQSSAYFQIAVHYWLLKDARACAQAVQRARLTMSEADLLGGAFECKLVALLVRCGDVPAARELADSFRDSATRAAAIERIAVVAADMGDRAVAAECRALHRQLMEPTWKAEPSEVRRRVMPDVYDIRAALAAKDVDAALRVAGRMTDTKDPEANGPQHVLDCPNARSLGFALVFHYLMTVGDPGRAAELLPRIFDRRDWEPAAARLAEDLLKRRELEPARALGQKLRHPVAVAAYQTALGNELARRGDTEGFEGAVRDATRAAGLITREQAKSLAHLKVVEALADAKEFGAATRVATQIRSVGELREAMTYVAARQVRAGQGAAAVDAAGQIKMDLPRVLLYEAVMAEQAAQRQREPAFATARAAGGKFYRCAQLLAMGYVNDKQFQRAGQLIKGYQLRPADRDPVFAAMAAAQAEVGLVKEAYASAAQIRSPWLRGDAIRDVIRSTFSLMPPEGNWERFVDALRTPEERFAACLGVTEATLGPPPEIADVR